MPFTSRNLCSSLSYQVRLARVCVFQSHEGASDRNGGLPRHLPYCSSSGFQAAKSLEASPRVTSLHSNLSTRPPVSQCFLFHLMPRGRLTEIASSSSVERVMPHLLHPDSGEQPKQICTSGSFNRIKHETIGCFRDLY